ncbi:MAG: thiopeptide-type bacteriocin biosynthesis protein [Acidobacteriota bacterium]
MATETAGYSWLSSQLYFEGDLYGAEADRVLATLVEPVRQDCLAQRWIRRCFFLRYGNMGAHIRFRCYGRHRVLEDHVKPRLIEAAQASGLIDRVEWEAYEPETSRYGGPCGVALAERFFDGSSAVALSLLHKIDAARRASRLGKALLAMLVLMHTFRHSRTATSELSAAYGSSYLHAMVRDAERRAALVEIYATGYDRQAEQLAPYIEAAWEALETDADLTPELDLYRHHLAGIQRRFLRLAEHGLLRGEVAAFDNYDHSVHQIVPSYIHMMNNRLGINTEEETYLSLVIHRTLDHLAVGAAASA